MRAATGLLTTALIPVCCLALAAAALAAPVAVSPTAGSPLASCPFEPMDVVPGAHPNAEVEPWVAVNPNDPQHIVAAWHQDRWDFGGARGILVGVSFDGGGSWTTVTDTKSTICTGGTAANNGDWGRTVDEILSFAPNGDLYMITRPASFHPGTTFNEDGGAIVTKSTDGGLSWSANTVLQKDFGEAEADKTWITADPTSAQRVYAMWTRITAAEDDASVQGNVHAQAHRSPTWFSRTTDGGQTWERARVVYEPGEQSSTFGHQIVVLPNGDLVAVFSLVRVHRNSDPARGQSVAVIRSSDGGQHWSKPTFIGPFLSIGARDPLTGQPLRTGRNVIDTAHDSGTNTIYVAWADARFSGGAYPDIVLTKSIDGGRNWSAPAKVNQTPAASDAGNRQAFTASVAVAGDGTVGVGYYDLRNNGTDSSSSNPLETDHFLISCGSFAAGSCSDAGGWAESRVTPVSFDLRKSISTIDGPPGTPPRINMGDYIGLEGLPSGFAALFVQANSAADPNTVYYSSAP